MANEKNIKIAIVVGARPNFMKVAPLFKELKLHKEIIPILIHTGQHSDFLMSSVFFRSLGLPTPKYTLDIKSPDATTFIGRAIEELGRIFNSEKPDMLIVVGDVNSTLCAAIAGNKCGIKVAHIEAGLRSFDRSMPEEVNRIIIDSISDFLFISEQSGIKNLCDEKIDSKKCFFVGNVMIDNLLCNLPKAKKSRILSKLKVNNDFALITIHRPSNVDNREGLKSIIKMIPEITKRYKITLIWPMHPRTKIRLKEFNLDKVVDGFDKLIITEPMDFHDLIKTMLHSKFILTDSGGIQEEAALLKVPTITLRENTERPSTIDCGANVLSSFTHQNFHEIVRSAIMKDRKKIKVPKYWDGKASKRIVSKIISLLNKHAK